MTIPSHATVAVFAPLRATFDYLIPADLEIQPVVGGRVVVPFGRSQRVGVVVSLQDYSDFELSRLKSIVKVLDPVPVLTHDLFSLGTWAADYYHHPLGEVFEMMLPGRLRAAQGLPTHNTYEWRLTELGVAALSASRLGTRQRTVLETAQRLSLTISALNAFAFDAKKIVRTAIQREWLTEHPTAAIRIAVDPVHDDKFLALNPHQQACFEQINCELAGYRGFVLHGVTGSGKTEIYLQLIREVLTGGGQALVLIPEIGLTEQLVGRFRERFGNRVAVVHSALSERARVDTWQQASRADIQVLVGTRSAVWMPLPNLRLIVVDEEHDLSYKQQDSMRYSARDVAVVRAHRANVPIILGSATPSLESLANCDKGKYTYLEIRERAGDAHLPSIKIVDIRGLPLHAGISLPLERAITDCVSEKKQALIFLNRRGYAPLALCHQCGWIAVCARCDARLVLHKGRGRLVCHHCGAEHALTAQLPGHSCAARNQFITLGFGTEQIEAALQSIFPAQRIARIDRDTMKTPRQLESVFAQVRAGEIDILLGTQMITKGHDFANVRLVGVIDADSRLLANDFRAEEKFAQMVVQVAGRAGRLGQQGQVLIQTHHPHHPIFEYLCSHRYLEFARRALAERAAAELPPTQVLAIVRAEATDRARPIAFLREVASLLQARIPTTVAINGPIVAPMEKRIGKYRANLMLTSVERGQLSHALNELVHVIEHSTHAKRVRWHIDVDAQEAI